MSRAIYSRGRDPRVPAQARREELIAALAQVLLTTPLLEVRIKQVTRAAGCPSGTFYRHFDGLPELAAALVDAKRAEAEADGRDSIDEPHVAAIAQLFAVEQQLPALA